jgi:hypothetical protein
LDIDKQYEPCQRESVSGLLKNAATMAEVFLGCLDPEEDFGITTLKKTKSIVDEENR